MKTNRRSFIKNLSQGTVAMGIMPTIIAVPENKSNLNKGESLTIKKVHMVFKTHMDIGFTASARKVTRNLWEWKIPSEIATARTCEKEGIKPSFTYGSWAVWETLQKQKGKKLEEIEKAIADDILVWTAMPFTPQSEYYDPSLFEFILSISQKLDQRFGKKTIAAKLTDVPGQTIGIVPYLAKAGVKFMHTGVNWASKNPEVPSVFIWKHPDGSEVVSMYCSDYGHPQGIEGHDEYLGMTFKGDNMDPWTPVEVRDAFAKMKLKFPEAEIVGSSLSNFALSLDKVKKRLPVVTQEIGDTWVYGCGTDPMKTSQFRELSRLRRQWLASGESDAATLEKFSVYLSLIGEHTWGMDHATYLDDWTNISNEAFRKHRQDSNYRILEGSWKEQREYVGMAIDTLPEKLAGIATETLKKLVPTKPDLKNYIPVINSEREIETPFFKVKIGKSGAIVQLIDKAKRKTWFDDKHPLGLFQYQTFSTQEIAAFDQLYWGNVNALADNSEMDRNAPVSNMWPVQMKTLYTQTEKKFTSILAELVSTNEAITKYGAPRTIFVEYTFSADRPEINIRVNWFEKSATRFREACWFSMVPVCQPSDTWRMEKIDSLISPLNVISYGSRNLHAMWEKVICNGKQSLQIETYDACLISPGKPAVYELHNQIPDMQKGVHFNLHNNLWATNYPAWYDEDALFRFKIVFS